MSYTPAIVSLDGAVGTRPSDASSTTRIGSASAADLGEGPVGQPHDMEVIDDQQRAAEYGDRLGSAGVTAVAWTTAAVTIGHEVPWVWSARVIARPPSATVCRDRGELEAGRHLHTAQQVARNC